MITLTGIPRIETERLVLRGPVTADFEPWAAFVGSERARFIGGPLDRGLAWRSFCHMTGHWVHRGFSMFAIEDRATGRPIGMTGPWRPEGWPEPEIGWSIWDPACEGGGFAFEAASAVRDWAWATLGWKTCVSYIHPENARSITLAERLGATRDAGAETIGDPPALVFRHTAPSEVPA